MSGSSSGKAPQDQAIRDRLVSELDTSFAVGAGAGSGKTSVLVDRVIELIDRGVDLDGIVAITFTEKAAAELRERVRAVLARAPELDTDGAKDRRLIALGKVDLSQLTTIHSFCRSILARHPLEAGVTPGFTVLDRLQSDLLLDEAASEMISRLREEESEELEGALLAGGRLTGLRDLVRAIRRYPDLEPELPGPAPESIKEVVADLLNTARLIAGYADVVPAKDRLLQQAVEALEQEPQLTSERLDRHDLASALEAATIHKNAGARGKWKTSPEAEEAFAGLKAAWAELSQRRDDAVEGYKGQQLAYLIEMASEIEKNYGCRKAELGALDFDDLLMKTEKLLESDPSVTEQIKKSYLFILVDEFQDTDPIQARIVQRLSEALDTRVERLEEAVPGAGRLFLVGDANQGIYRFRRADLSVFVRARSQLLSNGEEARLNVNFRSTPGLVQVANRIFPELLPAGEYHELAAHRGEDTSGPVVSLLDLDHFLDGGGNGRDDGNGHSARKMRVAEARALAGWICDRLEAGWLVFDKAQDEWRPLAFRDIAVLVRTYTGVPVFEDELDRCGIPYRVSGGRAFFQRLEIMQTIPVLRAVSDPGDEVAVVAAYRSPYFGVSDESLVRWAASGRPFAYLDGEDQPVDDAFIERYLDLRVDAPLIEARTILTELHRRALLSPPSRLLWQLFESTRALPLHALKPDGDRRMANLLKLADLAYAYEEAAASLAEGGLVDFGSLDGLVRYLEEQRRAAVEEESALVEEEGDAVTLMTIHSAKGLEFPVVALLDRAYKSEFLDEAIPDRSKGTATVKGAGLKPPGWEERKEMEVAEQEAEARRLLYVAFTRARDHVVLCGRRSEEGNGKRFLAPLETSLSVLADEEEGHDDAAGLVEWVVPSRPSPKEAVPHRLPYDLKEPSIEEIREAAGRRREAMDAWREIVSRALRSSITRASRLSAERELRRSVDEMRPATPSRWYARLRGIRVHAAMELAAILDKQPAEVCRAVFEPGDPAGLEPQVCVLVERGVELLDELRSQGWKVVATEWPLMLGDACEMMPGVMDDWVEVLTGTADLVLEDPEGGLLVVDYKTGEVEPEELLRLYRGQLQAYKTMLEKSVQRPVSAEIWSLSVGERIRLP